MAREIQDSPSLLDLLHRWMIRYQECIRHRDTDKAKDLFHPNVVGFGLETNRANSIEKLSEDWAHWNGKLAFTFDMESAAIIPANGFIATALNWTASPIIEGAPPKSGRATFLFALFDNGKFACLHEHLSINPSNLKIVVK